MSYRKNVPRIFFQDPSFLVGFSPLPPSVNKTRSENGYFGSGLIWKKHAQGGIPISERKKTQTFFPVSWDQERSANVYLFPMD